MTDTPADRALRRYEDAAKELQAYVEEALPVGTYVEVRHGHGHVRGHVERHPGCWWSSPTDVQIKVRSSGRSKRVDARHIEGGPFNAD